MICDKEGVPLLIQHIAYNRGLMSFEVTFFNGKKKNVDSSFACPTLGLFDMPTYEDYLEAEYWINKVSLHLWSHWFPVTSTRDYTRNMKATHE